MSSMFIVARHDARRVVVTPVLTPYLGQPLLTRRSQLTCLPRLDSACNRLGSVAKNLRETERYILKQSYYVALRHDSYTC